MFEQIICKSTASASTEDLQITHKTYKVPPPGRDLVNGSMTQWLSQECVDPYFICTAAIIKTVFGVHVSSAKVIECRN